MSMTIDRLRDRAIIRVKRKDRRYGTGQLYLTSISVDLGLIEFALRVFDGERARLVKWITATVHNVDSAKISPEGNSGFSRLVQREMLNLLGRQATITPLPKDEPAEPKEKAEPKAKAKAKTKPQDKPRAAKKAGAGEKGSDAEHSPLSGVPAAAPAQMQDDDIVRDYPVKLRTPAPAENATEGPAEPVLGSTAAVA